MIAAAITLVNIAFAWRYLTESNVHAGVKRADRPKVSGSRETLTRVVTHPALPASRLVFIYAIGMGAFQGMTAILALFLFDRHRACLMKTWHREN